MVTGTCLSCQVAPPINIGINDPSPTMLCDDAATAPRPTRSVKVVSDDLPGNAVATSLETR